MRKFAIVLALALLPAAAMAQQTPPAGQPMGGMRMGGQGRMQQNTIEWLLTQKDQFRPSEEQVTKLTALAKALNDSTAPLRDQMRKAREDAMSGGGDMRSAFEQLRPTMEKMRHMDEEATENALKLLNDEQKKVAKDLIDQRQKEMQARRRPAN